MALPEHDHRRHVERYALLPESTREWLESLREEDLRCLKEAAQFYHTATALGRFGKWIVLTIVAVFATAVSLGESIQKLFEFLRGH